MRAPVGDLNKAQISFTMFHKDLFRPKLYGTVRSDTKFDSKLQELAQVSNNATDVIQTSILMREITE